MVKMCLNFTEEQKDFLAEKSKRTKISIAAYLRMLIEDAMITDAMRNIEKAKAKALKKKNETEIITS